MPLDSKHLRQRLIQSGYSDSVISAIWPSWWSEEAESSDSAQIELRFSVARKLGLDPRFLLEDDAPVFVWQDEAKFKRLSGETEAERAAISSYGISIGRMLIAATQETFSFKGVDAREIRSKILENKTFIGLNEIVALSWGFGIPVIHLRVFPLTAKRMCAMSVRIGDRYAILLGKDANYPAPLNFYLAHELGHIALGHLLDDMAVVDLSDSLETKLGEDDEELAADHYALELLTGMQEPKVDTETIRFTAKQLADNLLQTGPQVHIEPGTLALCFGYTTGKWDKANAAMKSIYVKASPVWQVVNRIAHSQLNWNAIPNDFRSFLHTVIEWTSE